MPDILDRIKARLKEPDSPIRTVKGVSDAIGMSEGGFYRMVQRGTTKYATLVALAKSLHVSEDYLTGKTDINGSQSQPGTEKVESFGDEILQKLSQDLIELKQGFEEQLRAKDRQIDGLQRTIDVLVGKSEGAPLEPLSTDAFTHALATYRAICFNAVKPASRKDKISKKVGGTPLPYAGNTVVMSK